MPKWSKLERRDYGDGDFRDHLDGEPIHCGQALLMQATEWTDLGEGRLVDSGVRVRYEIDWNGGKHPVLCADVGGLEFTRRLDAGMRFRWPQKQER